MKSRQGEDEEQPDLQHRIDSLLQEIRVVLPGTQALIGFQLVAVFNQAFAQMQVTLKYAHGASIGLIGLAILLLMTPASYHRIALGGRTTEGFQHLASTLLVSAMFSLLAGFCLDLYVVISLILNDQIIASACATTFLVLGLCLWFGLGLLKR